MLDGLGESGAAPVRHLEVLVGLHVHDDELYSEYRRGMTPILTSYGGAFGYDFRVSEALKSESDEDAMRAFFEDPAYLEVKTRFFEPSVGGTQIIAQYAV
mgnify:CR=1 FL=1